MTLIIGADHRGTNAARHLAERLMAEGVACELVVPECGPRDYPDVAYTVAMRVANEPDTQAVLICGTGVGMSIAANKVDGVRAAVAHDELTAELSKSHVHANVLCMAADLLGDRLMEKIVDIWRTTDQLSGRHERRVGKIKAIEEGQDPRVPGAAVESKTSGCSQPDPADKG